MAAGKSIADEVLRCLGVAANWGVNRNWNIHHKRGEQLDTPTLLTSRLREKAVDLSSGSNECDSDGDQAAPGASGG
jgi:hypothetical protein